MRMPKTHCIAEIRRHSVVVKNMKNMNTMLANVLDRLTFILIPGSTKAHALLGQHHFTAARYTTRPSQIVALTRPSIAAPSNGVFRDFERDSPTAKLHSAAASKTTTSA